MKVMTPTGYQSPWKSNEIITEVMNMTQGVRFKHYYYLCTPNQPEQFTFFSKLTHTTHSLNDPIVGSNCSVNHSHKHSHKLRPTLPQAQSHSQWSVQCIGLKMCHFWIAVREICASNYMRSKSLMRICLWINHRTTNSLYVAEITYLSKNTLACNLIITGGHFVMTSLCWKVRKPIGDTITLQTGQQVTAAK